MVKNPDRVINHSTLTLFLSKIPKDSCTGLSSGVEGIILEFQAEAGCPWLLHFHYPLTLERLST